MSSTPENMAYAALALRCFGFILSLPLGDALSTFPRFFLAVGLAFALAPGAHFSPEPGPLSLLIEFVIGFVLGAPLRFVSDIAEMVGELIDTARGQTISALLDPLNGQGGSDLATLGKNAAVVLALWCGALEVALTALGKSVELIPIGTLMVDESMVRGILRTAVFLVTEGLRVCAVWVGAFLLIDIACALASKMMTGLSFTQAGGVLKTLVTFILLLILFTEGGRLTRDDILRALNPFGSAQVYLAPSPSSGVPSGVNP